MDVTVLTGLPRATFKGAHLTLVGNYAHRQQINGSPLENMIHKKSNLFLKFIKYKKKAILHRGLN